MANHFVHVGGQLTGEAVPLLGAKRLLFRPGELAAERRRCRSVVGLVHVRERDRLAAVLLADVLIVRQVDADRRDRPGVAGLDDDVDGVGGDAADALLLVLVGPGHAVLEPLGVGGDLPDLLGLFPVHEVDERFPRPLVTARIHVDLDEPVDRVHRRVLVLDPGHVVGDAIGLFTGAVELHQRADRLLHRRGRVGDCRLEVPDDRADLLVVTSADAVDLLDQLAVLLDDA